MNNIMYYIGMFCVLFLLIHIEDKVMDFVCNWYNRYIISNATIIDDFSIMLDGVYTRFTVRSYKNKKYLVLTKYFGEPRIYRRWDCEAKKEKAKRNNL